MHIYYYIFILIFIFIIFAIISKCFNKKETFINNTNNCNKVICVSPYNKREPGTNCYYFYKDNIYWKNKTEDDCNKWIDDNSKNIPKTDKFYSGYCAATTTTTNPETPIITPHGTTITPHGTTITPHGTTITPHRTTITPHGTTITPHGTTITPHGTTITPHGITITPHGITITPTTLKPTTTKPFPYNCVHYEKQIKRSPKEKCCNIPLDNKKTYGCSSFPSSEISCNKAGYLWCGKKSKITTTQNSSKFYKDLSDYTIRYDKYDKNKKYNKGDYIDDGYGYSYIAGANIKPGEEPPGTTNLDGTPASKWIKIPVYDPPGWNHNWIKGRRGLTPFDKDWAKKNNIPLKDMNYKKKKVMDYFGAVDNGCFDKNFQDTNECKPYEYIWNPNWKKGPTSPPSTTTTKQQFCFKNNCYKTRALMQAAEDHQAESDYEAWKKTKEGQKFTKCYNSLTKEQQEELNVADASLEWYGNSVHYWGTSLLLPGKQTIHKDGRSYNYGPPYYDHGGALTIACRKPICVSSEQHNTIPCMAVFTDGSYTDKNGKTYPRPTTDEERDQRKQMTKGSWNGKCDRKYFSDKQGWDKDNTNGRSLCADSLKYDKN